MFYFPSYFISFKALVLTTVFTPQLLACATQKSTHLMGDGQGSGGRQKGAPDPAVSEGRARKDLPGKVMSDRSWQVQWPIGKGGEAGIPHRGRKEGRRKREIKITRSEGFFYCRNVLFFFF